MKKTVLFTLLFSLTQAAMATDYDVTIRVTNNGKLVSNARLIVQEGQAATLTTDENFTEIVASPSTVASRPGILLQVVTGVMGSEGDRQVVTNGEMVVANNKTATMTVGTLANPKEKYVLTITPKIVKEKN